MRNESHAYIEICDSIALQKVQQQRNYSTQQAIAKARAAVAKKRKSETFSVRFMTTLGFKL